MTLTFRVLSALLAYPEPETVEALDEGMEILDREGLVPARARRALAPLVRSLRDGDALAAQERYVALFDRRRSASLHLYEHLHGESRDRGQAMVRLKQLYRLHGLEIEARELPDYLPLFLEFLSLIPLKAAQSILSEAMPVIAAIGQRLREWDSPYAAAFDAVGTLAKSRPQASEIKTVLKALLPEDDSAASLDKRWEEEAVSFLGGADPGGACGTPSSNPASPQR
jgi:nitrate reductase molybdenum cofactor assembly chaperone NarJ/NarW